MCIEKIQKRKKHMHALETIQKKAFPEYKNKFGGISREI